MRLVVKPLDAAVFQSPRQPFQGCPNHLSPSFRFDRVLFSHGLDQPEPLAGVGWITWSFSGRDSPHNGAISPAGEFCTR